MAVDSTEQHSSSVFPNNHHIIQNNDQDIKYLSGPQPEGHPQGGDHKTYKPFWMKICQEVPHHCPSDWTPFTKTNVF